MIKRLLPTICLLAASPALLAASPSVHMEPPQLQGSRAIEPLTRTAVVRDYLESWKSFRAAMAQNRPSLLDQDFAGTAKEKLTATIQEQAKLGIHTRYQDRSHDLQFVFYSPEGLSIQLIDNVVYEERVLDHDKKTLAKKQMRARYIVVLTPAQTRWKVRIFQAGPNNTRDISASGEVAR